VAALETFSTLEYCLEAKPKPKRSKAMVLEEAEAEADPAPPVSTRIKRATAGASTRVHVLPPSAKPKARPRARSRRPSSRDQMGVHSTCDSTLPGDAANTLTVLHAQLLQEGQTLSFRALPDGVFIFESLFVFINVYFFL